MKPRRWPPAASARHPGETSSAPARRGLSAYVQGPHWLIAPTTGVQYEGMCQAGTVGPDVGPE